METTPRPAGAPVDRPSWSHTSPAVGGSPGAPAGLGPVPSADFGRFPRWLPPLAYGYAQALEARHPNLRFHFHALVGGNVGVMVENVATTLTRERVVLAERLSLWLDAFALAYEVGP